MAKVNHTIKHEPLTMTTNLQTAVDSDHQIVIDHQMVYHYCHYLSYKKKNQMVNFAHAHAMRTAVLLHLATCITATKA